MRSVPKVNMAINFLKEQDSGKNKWTLTHSFKIKKTEQHI
jgi:hypothetical protein